MKLHFFLKNQYLHNIRKHRVKTIECSELFVDQG